MLQFTYLKPITIIIFIIITIIDLYFTCGGAEDVTTNTKNLLSTHPDHRQQKSQFKPHVEKGLVWRVKTSGGMTWSDLELVDDVNTFVAGVFEVDLNPHRKLAPTTAR